MVCDGGGDLALEAHPDRLAASQSSHVNTDASSERFRRVREAFEALRAKLPKPGHS